MAPHRFLQCAWAALAAGAAPAPLAAQSATAADSARPAIMAVVDSALSAITAGNFSDFADLLLPEAQIYSARTRDGMVVYRMRPASGERTASSATTYVERGFDALVRISGPVAVVWLPYDLYAGGQWSHCGVDVFTVVRVGSSWRIANLTYSVEQPPACRPHPKGPPPGMKAP